MMRWFKNMLVRLFWIFVLLLSILLSIPVVTLVITLPLMYFAIRRITYHAGFDKFGYDTEIKRVYFVGEGSHGSFTRETDGYLLVNSKFGDKYYSADDIKGDGKFQSFLMAAISLNKTGKVMLTDEQLKKFIVESNGGYLYE